MARAMVRKLMNLPLDRRMRRQLWRRLKAGFADG